MKTITLSIQEFMNFKKIFKHKFNSSSVCKGCITVEADKKKLATFGY